MTKSINIPPSGPLRGEIRVPGDKSISHRAVMLGAIADGTSKVTGFLTGEDSLDTARAFAAMGVEIEGLGGTELTIKGAGLKGLKAPSGRLDLGNSGTSMRLLSGILAGQKFGCILTGDQSLCKRPMDRIVAPLSMMGANVAGVGARHYPPLCIEPAGKGGLKGIAYSSPIASAQVKSAVLLAGLYAGGETSVTEPMKSRDHTERMLRYMGAEVREEGLSVSVKGGQRLTGRDFAVPGDISSAAFFMVAAAIVPGSRLLIRDVGVNTTRTGIIDVLRLMNAAISVLNPRSDGPEPVADILVEHSDLRGMEIGGELFLRAIDEFPILCVAAAAASGVTVVRDAAELRVKESDRIAAMARELEKAGVSVEETADGIVIEGGGHIRAARVNSYGDHRVAMSMAVLGLIAERRTFAESLAGGGARKKGRAVRAHAGDSGVREDVMVINDTECINTSFPGFEGLLDSLR